MISDVEWESTLNGSAASKRARLVCRGRKGVTLNRGVLNEVKLMTQNVEQEEKSETLADAIFLSATKRCSTLTPQNESISV